MNIVDSIINSQVYGGVVGVVPSNVATDNYNVDLDDYIVLCNFTTEKTITLPSDIENKVFIIKCIGNGNIKFATQLDGIIDFKLYKGGAVTVISKGVDYFIIGSCGYGI